MSAAPPTGHMSGAIDGLPLDLRSQKTLESASLPPSNPFDSARSGNLHTSRASRNLPSLLQAVDLSGAVSFGLTNHEIIVEGFASGTNEVGGAEERGRARSDLLHSGDRVGEGGGVDKNLLIKSRLCVRTET